MNRARGSTTAILLAFFFMACGPSTSATEPEGSGGSGSGAGGPGSVAGSSTSTGGSTGSGGTDASASTGSGGAGGEPPGDGGAGGSSTGGGPPVVEPTLITSGPNDYWKTGTPTEVTSGNADVTVDEATTHQRWDGFGGTFNEVGWNVLSMLGEAERARAIELLFDKHEGAAFAYGRIPIGASDYAMDRYTLDETPNDTAMASFSIDRDKERLIPYIKAALVVRPGLHLWASPWTPPTWMKSNGAFDGGRMKDDASTLQAYALYLAKFVEAYAGEGITIEAVHPQNEPNYETRYPSCTWTGALMAKFIGTYLGPTFADRGLTAQIYLGTMSNNESGKDGAIISAVTGDATAMGYVKGFGLQWNMMSSASGLRSRNLPIVQTEHKCGNYPWNPTGSPPFDAQKAPNDHAYAEESWGLIRDWIKAGVTSYSAWNMVLDTAGKNLDSERPWPQNALLTVDTAAKTLNVTPVYHVFRHVSEYVDPGATRVATTGGDALAFKNPDGSIVTILYNSGNAAKMTVLDVAGKKLQFSVPAHGWATVNWT
ncbi:glycoside hydrolase family 30 protein [Sorangium cellulosum]|uniref:glycoside hydrolase family 30 protein n=1 Tax=Sorangium cellulosum TaxID=56 RepID=UPI0005D1B279|nr:glycoside hydrolase family 30 beta sandwich domain-containing protein [Sorangium cellulosum]